MTTWVVVGVVVGVYAVASVATLVAYALDKRAARRSKRRIRERTLHTFEFLGGWPGAMLAQRWLRHKTVDSSYRLVFWVIVGVHGVAWAIVLWLWLAH